MSERWRVAERAEARRNRTSPSERQEPPSSRRRRVLAVVIGVALLGGLVAVAQISSAGTGRRNGQPPPACTNPPSSPTNGPADPTVDPSADPSADPAADPAAGTGADAAHQHNDSRRAPAACQPSSSPAGPVAQPDSPGNSCDNSTLPVHDGFQNGDRCVATDRGEVPSAENAPSLLIVSAPRIVRANRPFEIRISTRNLVRSFFLPAATGGYYVTRSFLTEEGMVVGHVHTAIRPLSTTRVAPDPAPVPTFFKATEDSLGGKTPDTFVVQVPGIATPGLYQIASWAGDASHGVPSAQRANQTPAFDAVRLIVTR